MKEDLFSNLCEVSSDFEIPYQVTKINPRCHVFDCHGHHGEIF